MNINSILFRYGIGRIFRRITSPVRMLPDFLIIGYPKCGTTSLHFYLSQHPSVGKSSKKEIHFFSIMYDRGLNWYKARFPTILYKKYIQTKKHIPFITGESSVEYASNPLTPERIKADITNVKIIIVLRNPVDRAYSSYHAAVKDGIEYETFENAIEKDQDRFESRNKKILEGKLRDHTLNILPVALLSFGKYVEHLPKWLELFPNQILIINYDEFSQSPKKTLDNLFEFLKISNFEVKDKSKRDVGKYEPMNSQTRKKLVEYYKPYNEKLEKVLNLKLNWDK